MVIDILYKYFSTTIFKLNQINIVEQYDAKVLIAFGETFGGNEELHLWLLNNGYQELAALSSAIRGSREAAEWLMNNGYPHFVALDLAIDHNLESYNWLIKNGYTFYARFSDACNRNEMALNWFQENDLKIFLFIIARINQFRDNQTFDYHKLNF